MYFFIHYIQLKLEISSFFLLNLFWFYIFELRSHLILPSIFICGIVGDAMHCDCTINDMKKSVRDLWENTIHCKMKSVHSIIYYDKFILTLLLHTVCKLYSVHYTICLIIYSMVKRKAKSNEHWAFCFDADDNVSSI